MAYSYDPQFLVWMHFWDSWHKWFPQKPSLKHPIKYIKWYRSEPQYRKEAHK